MVKSMIKLILNENASILLKHISVWKFCWYKVKAEGFGQVSPALLTQVKVMVSIDWSVNCCDVMKKLCYKYKVSPRDMTPEGVILLKSWPNY
jgi:hypothetical protein